MNLTPRQATALLDKRRRRLPRRETDLVAAIIKALRAIGVFCYRSPAGFAVHKGKNGKRYYVRHGPPGQPDITGVVPVPCLKRASNGGTVAICRLCAGTGRLGLALAIEVKTEAAGDAKPHQQIFLAAVRATGGIAVVAHSVEEALAAVLPRMGRIAA